jgi:RNase H-fold protein (predicted Holliday junction resolvase)
MSVRPAGYRRSKYEAKIDGVIVGQRFTAEKENMVNQVDERFAELVKVEDDVKSVLEDSGVTTITIPFYLNFARECYRRKKQFTGATLRAEVEVLQNKWIARGLDLDMLTAIKRYFAIPGYAY